MQKIAIKENMQNIRRVISSDQIYRMLTELFTNYNTGTDLNQNWNSHKNATIQEIIKSKSNFDNLIMANPNFELICNAIGLATYSTENISSVISILSNTKREDKNSLFTQSIILNFLSFHKSIISSDNINKATVNEDLSKSNVVTFTVVSESDPTISKVISALSILQELIDLIEKLYNEEQTNTIYLLDKGSDTNIGIETGVNTAKSLFQIFKEVWDWLVNRKYYKEKLKNAAFLEELSIIKTIHSMKEEGSIDHEEALRYKTMIMRKIDELLNIDTVPRELLIKEALRNDTLILKDYNEIRLLKEGID